MHCIFLGVSEESEGHVVYVTYLWVSLTKRNTCYTDHTVASSCLGPFQNEKDVVYYLIRISGYLWKKEKKEVIRLKIGYEQVVKIH